MATLENNVSEQIQFNFTYYAMKLLGRNLYSSPWTAISEIVANGIDAGAEKVYVYVDMSDKHHSVVEIFDNGNGMTKNDLANKYTLIGRNRREQTGDNNKDKTLGRKGIGKLAALYLSSQYVLSTKTATSHTTWQVDTKKFKDSDIPTLDKVDYPVEFSAQTIWNSCKTGTMIHLSDVDLRNIGEEKIKKLSAILADYYLDSVIKSKIYVCVVERKSQPIKFIPISKKIQYETMYCLFDNREKQATLKSKVYLTEEDDYDIVNTPRNTIRLDPQNYACDGEIEMMDLKGKKRTVKYHLSGWLGIHVSLKKSILTRNVEDVDSFITRSNTIRLYVRGKLAVENLMNYIDSNQALAKYIEGELSFDVLDDDEFEDSSTSSREGYTLSDPRVKKLIDIAGKICSSLITERSKIGSQINRERDEYLNNIYEEQRRQKEEQERLRKIAEQQKDEADKQRAIAEKELEKTQINLGSEKRRNSFLKDSLSEDQISYSKRLHMVKINNSTIKNIIKGLVEQKKRNLLTLDSAWRGIQDISYCNQRSQAVLEYYAKAEFDPKDEKVNGDIFEFIAEYCKEITQKVCEEEDQNIVIETTINGSFPCSFVPQDIGVVIDNIVSNSYKNKANRVVFEMYLENGQGIVKAIDNGNGLDPNADVNSLFEFGKSFTKYGTGVGLYHIRQIINDMGGFVTINIDKKDGFELKMRF